MTERLSSTRTQATYVIAGLLTAMCTAALQSGADMRQKENGHSVYLAKNVHHEIEQTWDGGKRAPARHAASFLSKDKKPLAPEAYERWKRIEHPALSANGRWAVYLLSAAKGDAELVIRATQRQSETRIPQVMSFALPRASGAHIAYKQYAEAAQTAPAADSPRKTVLVLRNLASGAETRLPNAAAFTFDNAGRYLAYSIASRDPSTNGVYLRRLADDKVTKLLTGTGDHRSLRFDASGEQLAFLSNHPTKREEGATATPLYSLYYSQVPWTEAEPVVDAATLAGKVIVADSGVTFSRAGNSLLFNLSLPELKPAAALITAISQPGESSEGADPESSEVSTPLIWDWTEPQPFPNGIKPEPRGPYLATYRIPERRLVQLGSGTLNEIWLSDDATRAIAIDRDPYRVQNTWDLPTVDLYLIDTMSGESRRLRSGIQSTLDTLASLSPGGRYVLTFEHRRWISFDLHTQRQTDLTGRLLPNTRFDTEGLLPGNPPEGIAGWTAGDGRLIVYDRHDLWELDPTGATAPRNLTAGLGRRENLRFRLFAPIANADDANRLTPPAPALLDPNRPLLLTALDRDTMASGLWRTRPARDAEPEKLVMLEKRLTPLGEASNVRQYLVSLESFTEYPDLWAGSRFDQLKKISDANPQQREYRWGTVEVIRFTSTLAVPLQARLYKPEGFDPQKKYPMIVSIHEREAEKLHLHTPPELLTTAVSAEAVNPTFVSQGYIVLVPDVQPTSPYPGQSALASVLPAVQGMIQRGYVDPQRICLTGHGFGGYAVAYLITQTTMFRCAIEGSGVTNTISAYASLRTRARSFEKGPWRHGSSVWERPFVYLTNAPLLFADKVTAPLLILHNDGEQEIPYDQGFEYFTGLRRNGKEVYLLNYREEGYTLQQRENRLDWDQRVHEYLDHFLKDGPKPKWFEFPIE